MTPEQWELAREEFVTIAAAQVVACTVNKNRLRELHPEDHPYPRIHRCFNCGMLTSQAPTSVVMGTRRFSFPAFCAEEAACDESLHVT